MNPKDVGHVGLRGISRGAARKEGNSKGGSRKRRTTRGEREDAAEDGGAEE